MSTFLETEDNNHKYFYKSIEANRVNIEWLNKEISNLNKKIDHLTNLSTTTLISLLLGLASFLLSHIKFHF